MLRRGTGDGSRPPRSVLRRTIFEHTLLPQTAGAVAQLAERLNRIQEVEGSIPFRSIPEEKKFQVSSFRFQVFGVIHGPAIARSSSARNLKLET
jgi:hypothetical protein